MTFPTGFQSFIDSSTPTPANLLEQQPFASPILPGGEWGREGLRTVGALQGTHSQSGGDAIIF